jgi:signal transduction histidine kinase
MNGDIELRSDPDEGTEITISLPLMGRAQPALATER